MVISMRAEYVFAAVGEKDLNDIIAGRRAGRPTPLTLHAPTHLHAGEVGVVWQEGRKWDDVVQPLLLIVREEDQRRLFSRFAQLRSDLSPLSPWCHIVTPKLYEALDGVVREADLGGLEAAWTSLIVAETLLLAGRPLAQLRVAACLATQSFAIARAQAIWSPISADDIISRYDAARRLLRASDPHTARLRIALEPIWACLVRVSGDKSIPFDSALDPIVRSLRALKDARDQKDPDEAHRFAEPLKESGIEVGLFRHLLNLPPEQRVREFDRIIFDLAGADRGDSTIYRHTLALVAGYLATVVAGGSPSLTLTEATSNRWPEIAAWAHVVGSIGERVVWTSSFDGLGRIVARELMRPLNLTERPICDFALDEALVLVDPQLTDPLVHLRIKQSRIVAIALLPGLNILMQIGDQLAQEDKRPERLSEPRPVDSTTEPAVQRDLLRTMADALWPYLRARMEDDTDLASTRADSSRSRRNQSGRGGKRPASQSKLGLD
jgi:hypothetical protein